MGTSYEDRQSTNSVYGGQATVRPEYSPKNTIQSLTGPHAHTDARRHKHQFLSVFHSTRSAPAHSATIQ